MTARRAAGRRRRPTGPRSGRGSRRGSGRRTCRPRPGAVAVLALGLLALPGPGVVLGYAGGPGAAGLRAQEPVSAVLGDTVRVGDVVPVAVRVIIERGQRVIWPDTLPLGGEDVENAARVRERVDTLDDGRLQVTGVYAVTPWRTGESALPAVAVRVVRGNEVVETLTASLPALDVVSVLPPDTTGIEPRPAKGVVGPSWALWPFVLALLLLLALIAALVWWLRRRRRTAPVAPATLAMPPRERALEALREAREAGLVERGEMKEFYTRVAAILRRYLAELGEGWSEDLTTSELLARLRARVDTPQAARLADVLGPADQVKFARRRPDAGTAYAEWERAREWVEGFRWPPPAPDVEEAA